MTHKICACWRHVLQSCFQTWTCLKKCVWEESGRQEDRRGFPPKREETGIKERKHSNLGQGGAPLALSSPCVLSHISKCNEVFKRTERVTSYRVQVTPFESFLILGFCSWTDGCSIFKWRTSGWSWPHFSFICSMIHLLINKITAWPAALLLTLRGLEK